MSEQETKKVEYVGFEVTLPKEVLEFLEANKKGCYYHDVEAYVNLSLLQTVLADIEAGEFDSSVKALIENELGKDDLRKLPDTPKQEATAQTSAIEYEQMTINVPKQVMKLLKFAESTLKGTPKEWVEYILVDHVRANIDSGDFLPDATELTKMFNLNPVFKEILNDPV